MSNSEIGLLAIIGFLAFLCSSLTTSGIRTSHHSTPSYTQPTVAQIQEIK